MKEKVGCKKLFCISFFACVTVFAMPMTASAQFVPVNDANLIAKFAKYSGNFDKYASNMDKLLSSNPDSIKNVITGAHLTEAAAGGPCDRGNFVNPGGDVSGFAYDFGNWASSSDITVAEGYAEPLPKKVPVGGGAVQVNKSVSVRCLLQDMIEWQKLGLSVQINQLLKSYIIDAQTAQLQNQLLNKISAANINWANSGNVVNNDGFISNSALYNVNPAQSMYNAQTRVLDNTVDQYSADPGAGNPAGSAGIFADWRPETAATIAMNAKSAVVDPDDSLNDRQSTIDAYLAPGTSADFYEQLNTPTILPGKDGISTLNSMFSNPANSRLGSMDLGTQDAAGRFTRTKALLDQQNSTSGYTPNSNCGIDPHCVPTKMTDVTPAGEVARSVGVSAGAGQQQVATAKNLDSGASSPAESQTINIAQSGLNNYDTTNLQLSKTAVTKLVKELYDVINVGYFGLNGDTKDWANATMLMIYDEMKFNPESTAVEVTDSSTDETDTGYSGAYP